jgi:ligand-binding sensor domain-containing protein
MLRIVLVWVFVMAMLATTCIGQATDYYFYRVPDVESHVPKELTCFMKDRKGYLWIGGYNGLSRFDGQHYFEFGRKYGDKNRLQTNEMLDLCEGKSGKIWGTTNLGMFCFDPHTKFFKTYSTAFVGDGPAMENILCDASGNIWAAGIPGVMKYNAVADSFERVGADTTKASRFTENRVRKNGMLEDVQAHGIWVATRKGLNFIDYKTGKITNHTNQKNHPLFTNHSVRALARSGRGFNWMFDVDAQQLIAFNSKAEVLRRITVKNQKEQLVPGCIFEDRQGRLWIASYDYQVHVIEPGSDSLKSIVHKNDNPLSIRSDFFWDALQDEDGTIWLATFGGVAFCNTDRNYYKWIRTSENLPELKTSYPFVSLRQNPKDSSCWIGTATGKMLRYKPSDQSVQSFDLSHLAGADGTDNINLHFLTCFAGDTVFLNSGKGTWWFIPGRTSPRYIEAKYPNGSPFVIREMHNLGNGIFACTDYQKLAFWNVANNTTRIFDPPARAKITGSIHPPLGSMRLSPKGKIWISDAYGGFSYFDEQKQAIVAMPFTLSDEMRRSTYSIDFSFDNQDNLLMGYLGRGLYQYDVKQKVYRGFDDRHGLQLARPTAVLQDRFSRLWCFQNNRVAVYEPRTRLFSHFNLPFGEKAGYYQNLAIMMNNGNLLETINGDLVEFYPDKIISRPVDPQPLISSLEVSGKKIMLEPGDKIELKPDENFLTVKFGTQVPQIFFPHLLKYKLEGVDKDWRTSESNGEVVYSHLPPGKFTFRVMVLGNDNTWRSPEKFISIAIGAPFYKAVWFRVMVVLVLGLLLYGWYREKLKHQAEIFDMESKAQRLAREKSLVQYESLKQHLNPHFLFNSLSSLSSLIEIDPKVAGKFLLSLSRTYRYILQSKEKETVPLNDELEFVKGFVELQQTRFNEGLQLIVDVPEEYRQSRIVPVTLQNMVENATKHNIVDDENILRIEIIAKDGYLYVRNKTQLKKYVETSNKQGLDNLKSLYSYLTEKPLSYGSEGEYFIIKIPLI